MQNGWVVFILAVFILAVCWPVAGFGQSSLTFGDEVFISGGPGQPPRSIQTGLKLEINTRGPGTVDVSSYGRPTFTGRGLSMSGFSYHGSLGVSADPGTTPDSTEKSDPSPAPSVTPALIDFSRMRTSDAVSTLFDGDPSRRFAAARAMGSMGPSNERKDLVQALIQALGDRDPKVVKEVAWALGRLKDTAASPALMNAVSQGDDKTALAAIQALEELGDRSVVKELSRLADRDPGAVGQAARHAVETLSRPSASPVSPSPRAP